MIAAIIFYRTFPSAGASPAVHAFQATGLACAREGEPAQTAKSDRGFAQLHISPDGHRRDGNDEQHHGNLGDQDGPPDMAPPAVIT
jgi:hypothetical protein